MANEELTPKEFFLKREGEELLKHVLDARTDFASQILGPDGVSVKSEAVPRQQEVANNSRRQLVEELSKRLLEITTKDEVAMNCCQLMLVCHKLLYWAKIELAHCDDMLDMLVDYAEHSMRAKVEMSAGYHLASVRNDLRNFAVPFVDDRVKHYMRLAKFRSARMERFKRRIKEDGISIPVKAIRDRFEAGFQPGAAAIFQGPYPAVRHLLKLCSSQHMKQDGGEVYYLSCLRGETQVDCDWATKLMPYSWWNNTGKTLSSLDETLRPVVDSAAALVVIEDLETFFMEDKARVALERKVLALRRLYAWANENAIALLIGDTPNEAEVPDNVYGSVTCFKVDRVRSDGAAYVEVAGELVPAGEFIFRDPQ